jgi:hypothetical protein
MLSNSYGTPCDSWPCYWWRWDFNSGRAAPFALLPVHMRMGEVLIALLWILAGIGLRAGVKPGLAIGAIVYGFLAFAFAMNMGQLLPGGAHEVVRVLHLLIGLGAVGLAEILAARIKRVNEVRLGVEPGAPTKLPSSHDS